MDSGSLKGFMDFPGAQALPGALGQPETASSAPLGPGALGHTVTLEINAPLPPQQNKTKNPRSHFSGMYETMPRFPEHPSLYARARVIV